MNVEITEQTLKDLDYIKNNIFTNYLSAFKLGINNIYEIN